MSQFQFLKAEFPDLLNHAAKAEQLAMSDPRGACFWARLTLETAVHWLYRHDPSLRRPYARELNALITEPTLTQLMGPTLVTKTHYVKNQGNRAAHDSGRPLTSHDSSSTLSELFHITYWLARTYAKQAHPDAGISFDPRKLEASLTISASTVAEIRKLSEQHDQERERREEAEAARIASEEARLATEAELAQLKAEYAALRQANQARPDTHDYAEAETRDRYIDLLLAEAGWPLDQERDREFPVQGMPNQSGDGFVDYVLWGDDGKPLALIEAKRTKKDAMGGQQQAKLYADCLEKRYGRRPIIFCSNGYDHWIWDDAFYPPRRITATPRDEIDRDTYSLFELEKGVPTDAYDLEDAVNDGYLVPPKGISVPLKFQRQGISYADLSEEEKEEWDAIEWNDDGVIPDRVEAADLNKWLFNKDTVDKVLAQLMADGIKIEGGDKLGKTIIFAKSSLHAQFIAERFDANYPHLAGQFARVIDYSISYAQSLIDDFSNPAKFPQIAISVDMLDTGIDVPEVVNLVFFKPVRSKTKFWQMVGRGTRLCPDLFGPDEDKEEFIIFDYCQNLEFFGENPKTVEPSIAAPISERLFNLRLDLITEIDAAEDEDQNLRQSLLQRLQEEVAGINPDNFIVRPHRREVERFQQSDNWSPLTIDSLNILKSEIAGLPTAFKDDSLPAKQFDLLILRAQIALLRNEASFVQAQTRIRVTAAALETLDNIPLVTKHMPLILEIQTDEYWTDITISMLEEVRRKLRSLVELIKAEERKLVTTDFEDKIGTSTVVDLPDVGVGIDKARFKKKARAFVEKHQDHITIQKVRRGEQLTALDLSEIERVFLESGIADEETLDGVKADGGLGMFLRSLTGMDRAAAKEAFSSFISAKPLSGDQIEFIEMIVNALTENGLVSPETFYESPFTDLNDMGIAGVFETDQARQIITIVRRLNEAAAAAA